jgi:SulP family sulfate permease
MLPTLDEALARVEEEILEGEAATAGDEAGFDRLLARASASDTSLFAPETVPAGAQVLGQGEESDCLILLQRGRLSASVDGPPGEGRMRVATFLPGAVVGEIGLYAGTPRTATVVADVESVVRKVTRDSLECLSEADPALARDFHAMVAGLLARRLTRTTALLREVNR